MRAQPLSARQGRALHTRALPSLNLGLDSSEQSREGEGHPHQQLTGSARPGTRAKGR